ncbi:MAG: rare lipoprotein A [bacterium]|jgi:rare lipoprotein A
MRTLSIIKYTLLSLTIATFASSCTAQYHTSSQRKFYTPVSWQTPIQKNRLISTPSQRKNSLPQKIKKQFVYGNYKIPTAEKKILNTNMWSPGDQLHGYASWYGPNFHGKKTANGETYNQFTLTAAHKILPINTWIRVINLENNRSTIVRINDRGPYKKDRVIDLSRLAAERLDIVNKGTAKVKIQVIKFPPNYDRKKGLTPYKQVVIQIAVFHNPKNAQNYTTTLGGRYKKLNLMVDELKAGSYHVVAGPYNSRKAAHHVAILLKKDGIQNFVRSYRK